MIDLVIVILCLGLNAFFSAFEMAFVTTSREEMIEMEELGPSVVSRLNLFKRRPERTLSVIQIGITLVGAVAAAVGGTGAVESLEPYLLDHYGLSGTAAEAISVALVILPLTYFSVVFGELVPKTIALKHPKKVLRLGTNTLNLFDKALSPIVSFLEISTNFLLKMIGLADAPDEDEARGQMIDISNLQPYHQKFVQNLVSLRGKRAIKSMIPWEKVAYLHYSDSEEEVRSKIGLTPHSRFPVIDEETLVGILNLKELPDVHRQVQVPWQSVLKGPIIIGESEKVLEAFLRMQEKHSHMAVIEDDEGTFIGVITIEDILEEIVGDIHDNSDHSRTSRMLAYRGKINLKK